MYTSTSYDNALYKSTYLLTYLLSYLDTLRYVYVRTYVRKNYVRTLGLRTLRYASATLRYLLNI